MAYKIYISGPITGVEDYRVRFSLAAAWARKKHKFKTSTGGRVVVCDDVVVLNPCILPDGMEYEDYMKIDLAMVDVCDAVLCLPGWENSPGAQREVCAARKRGKEILIK